MMWSLFDQEKATELYGAEQRREGREEGLKTGMEKGREEQMEKMAAAMLKDNRPFDEIVKYSSIAMDRLNEIAKSLQTGPAISLNSKN